MHALAHSRTHNCKAALKQHSLAFTSAHLLWRRKTVGSREGRREKKSQEKQQQRLISVMAIVF